MKWLEKVKNSNFNFAKNGKRFLIAPIIIFVIGLIIFLIPGLGLNLGLDFTGGAILTVNSTDIINKDYIESKMNEYNVKYSVVAQKSVSGGDTFSIKFNANDKNTEILDELKEYFGDSNIVSSGNIQAQTSNEKIMNIFWSILAAWAGLMVYMLFRFKFTAGISTLLALVHDVLIICSLMAIFQIEINAPFIAALLTVISYSINNSLVVFDRVRDIEKNNTENLNLEQILNKSISRTLGRCALTVLTTLVTLVILTVVSLFMQLPTLIEFALPIILGLIAGTYSSLFLIAPMYLQFEGASILRKQRKKA